MDRPHFLPRRLGCPNMRHSAEVLKLLQQDPKLLQSWRSMRYRCANPSARYYHIYGGRGIKVCDRWLHSFENFALDMGARPTPRHTLDRIDVEGDYSPENCRWATPKEQGRNVRKNINVTIDGVTQCVSAWCEMFGVPATRTIARLHRGWPIERALFDPARPTGRKRGLS
jgi:hypothetical protein